MCGQCRRSGHRPILKIGIHSLLAVERSKGQVGKQLWLCFGRLKTLIKRLQAEEQLLHLYDKTIQHQLHPEIIEEVLPEVDQA
ncbi:unnamed protein product, partial [Onchocerca ochengi]|uniref:Transposase n=1 Tax=Onchocerca ochengi TaxID=42157 RepID=A0A182EYS9_ONCOC